MPAPRGLSGGGLGVAFVIGPDDDERALVAGSLGDLTDLVVVAGAPRKATLAALGSRDVRLIAVAAGSLDGVGFRNEFTLRCRQPRLSSVPILVYGRAAEVEGAARRLPGAGRVGHETPGELEARLRQQVARLEPAEAS